MNTDKRGSEKWWKAEKATLPQITSIQHNGGLKTDNSYLTMAQKDSPRKTVTDQHIKKITVYPARSQADRSLH
jgi:hypothetical protein